MFLAPRCSLSSGPAVSSAGLPSPPAERVPDTTPLSEGLCCLKLGMLRPHGSQPRALALTRQICG